MGERRKKRIELTTLPGSAWSHVVGAQSLLYIMYSSCNAGRGGLYLVRDLYSSNYRMFGMMLNFGRSSLHSANMCGDAVDYPSIIHGSA